ncbi:MAG: hypothetical protein Q4E77_03775 [Conchiformibius sp.]|nr:hypothetical protein [Conchiformibius sp.]
MATIMEKESLIDLIAYAKSIISLRMERSEQYEELVRFLAKKDVGSMQLRMKKLIWIQK